MAVEILMPALSPTMESGKIAQWMVKENDTVSSGDILAEIRDLAARAAAKRLKPSEYEGGSFSVSNLGMFGIEHFTAVINPPQAAILAVGGPVTQLRLQDGATVEQTDMRVTLSCDHRAVDGAVGAQFLAALADYVDNPILLSL